MTFDLYLTGAPATGKSTVGAALAKISGAELLSYGSLLTDELSRLGLVSDQVDLRERSAQVISSTHVTDLDEVVARRVERGRGISSTIVDSHALTAEEYGFRALPYSSDTLSRISFTHVVCLFAPSKVIAGRFKADKGGRRELSRELLDIHAQLQSSLALTYAHSLGVPIGFVDANRPLDDVVAAVHEFVGKWRA